MHVKVPHPRPLLIAGSILVAAGALTAGRAAAQERPPVTIGVLTDGPLGRFSPLIGLLERETRTLLQSRHEVHMGADTRFGGDNTLNGIRDALETLLSRTDVDVIIAVGTMAAHVAAGYPNLTKPVIAPFILDPALQAVPRTGATSGVGNFVYLTRPRSRDLEMLAEVVDFRRIAVLVSAPTLTALPETRGRIEAAVAAAGREAVVIPVGTDVAAALAAVGAAEADAAYILPLTELSDQGFTELADGLVDLGIPSVSWFGEPEVRQGILLGSRPETFLFQIARLTALNVNHILRGEAPGALRVTFVPQERVIVNMETARATGAYPSWAMMSDALVIDTEATAVPQPQLLDSVIREAVAQNQDLAAFDRALQAAAQDVKLATSRLLPQLSLDVTGTMIDEDRAARSFGVLPERSLMGGIELSQVVYADRLWADRTLQQSLQRAREEDYRSLQLDVSYEAVDAYLSVLRRKTDERIRRENLEFTRTNRDLSEVRRQTGAATSGEVLRWEAQVARDRQGLVHAGAFRALAETRLNRLLHRPVGDPVATPPTDFEDPVIRWAEDALMRLLDNPESFEGFEAFVVEEALASAPELRAVDAIIGGQERTLAAARRAFWLPEFFLGARLSNRFLAGGAGSDPPTGGLLPTDAPDSWRWSVQLGARYLIFGGGSRSALATQAEQSVFSLAYQRASTAERVDQRMRDALQLLVSSRVRVELARDAATAARGNFELVQTAYAGGVTGILSLLDAQNTVLVAELDASNALYDFITDFVGVQRAAGRIDLFLDAAERQAFLDRLTVYLQDRGTE